MLATQYYLEFPAITRERARGARNFLAPLFQVNLQETLHFRAAAHQPLWRDLLGTDFPPQLLQPRAGI
jgi:hypothetical protein